MKSNCKYFCYLIYVLFSVMIVSGQDPHFSQYAEQQSLLNPALTGASGSLRFSAAYKNQWSSMGAPYKTMGAAFEIRTPGRLVRKGRFGTEGRKKDGMFAGGLSFYNDNAGDGSMKSNQVNISLAVFVHTSRNSALSLGFQASYLQKRLDAQSLVFPSQYGGTGYDPNIPSGEGFVPLSFSHADYAAGVLWSLNNGQKEFSAYQEIKGKIGFSMYHLMKPGSEYKFPSTDILFHKYVVHADFQIGIPKTQLEFAPAFVYQVQGPAREILAGVMLSYYKSHETKFTGYVQRTSFGIGAYYRNNDAAILSCLFEWHEKYAIGLSYDLNISTLSVATRVQGGYELTLRYTPQHAIRGKAKSKLET